MAVGIKNGKRWQSGCMQGGTRLQDSKRTSTALSLARGLSHSDRLGPWPSVLSKNAMDLNKNTRSRQHEGSRRQSRSRKRTKKREKRDGKGKSGCGGLRRNMTNTERIQKEVFQDLFLELGTWSTMAGGWRVCVRSPNSAQFFVVFLRLMSGVLCWEMC